MKRTFFNVQRGLRRFALSRHLPTVGRQTHQHQRSRSLLLGAPRSSTHAPCHCLLASISQLVSPVACGMSTQSSILSFFGRASSYPPAKRHKADTKSNDTTSSTTTEPSTTSTEPSKPEPKPPSPSPSPEREGPDFEDDTLVLQDGRSALLKDFDIGTIFTPSTRVYAPARRASTTPRPSISRTSSLSSEPKSPERQLLGLSTPPSSPSKQHRSASPSKHTNNTRSVPSSPTKMPKKRKLEQLFLDFGQRNLESTTCAECGMVYSVGVPSDEQLHRQYHGSRAATLRIPVRSLALVPPSISPSLTHHQLAIHR